MKAFQTAGVKWPSLMMRKSFFKNGIQGLIFALSFSAFVLLATSKSFILTLMSLLCIINVLLTLMAPIYLFNWCFGLTESIGMIVFIGLSVDYIIHICHSYAISMKETRKERTFDAISQMGWTIFSGALTSCMAGFFLLSC
jgi:predicted RND superfamily exporter protein